MYLDRIPGHLGAKRYLASAYLALGDWENVIKTYRVSFRDPIPRDPTAISLIAEAYRQQGRFKRAEELYLQALEIAPKSAGLALKLAQSRIDSGEIDKAKAAIRCAPRVACSNVPTRNFPVVPFNFSMAKPQPGLRFPGNFRGS